MSGWSLVDTKTQQQQQQPEKKKKSDKKKRKRETSTWELDGGTVMKVEAPAAENGDWGGLDGHPQWTNTKAGKQVMIDVVNTRNFVKTMQLPGSFGKILDIFLSADQGIEFVRVDEQSRGRLVCARLPTSFFNRFHVADPTHISIVVHDLVDKLTFQTKRQCVRRLVVRDDGCGCLELLGYNPPNNRGTTRWHYSLVKPLDRGPELLFPPQAVMTKYPIYLELHSKWLCDFVNTFSNKTKSLTVEFEYAEDVGLLWLGTENHHGTGRACFQISKDRMLSQSKQNVNIKNSYEMRNIRKLRKAGDLTIYTGLYLGENQPLVLEYVLHRDAQFKSRDAIVQLWFGCQETKPNHAVVDDRLSSADLVSLFHCSSVS